MPLVLTSGPAVEPITLAEAKAHLRVDTDADDLLISALITTSRLQIEAALSIALIHQVWSYFFDAWPADERVAIPLRPLASLDAINVHLADASATSISGADFELDGISSPPRVTRRAVAPLAVPPRRTNAYQLTVTAGFGATPEMVPAPLRHAVLLLVAHWYEHRGPTEQPPIKTTLPAAISDLVTPWRPVRLL